MEFFAIPGKILCIGTIKEVLIKDIKKSKQIVEIADETGTIEIELW